MTVMVLVLASCGSAGSGPPWGLEDIDQPSDEPAIAQVLGAMPDVVAGRDRAASPEALEVAYGDEGDVRLRVLRFGEEAAAEGYPATAVGFLEMLAGSGGGVEVEARALDPNAGLVYVVCIVTESFARGGSLHETKSYAIAWGEPGAEWVFSAVADSPESRLALIEAFVDAAASRP